MKTIQIAGVDVQSVDTQPLGLPLAAASWCLVDGALLIATDNKMLERCLVAGREDIYLGWFYRNYGARADAIDPAAEAEYLRAYRQPGALRAVRW